MLSSFWRSADLLDWSTGTALSIADRYGSGILQSEIHPHLFNVAWNVGILENVFICAHRTTILVSEAEECAVAPGVAARNRDSSPRKL
jgi:hypothetical protein